MYRMRRFDGVVGAGSPGVRAITACQWSQTGFHGERFAAYKIAPDPPLDL